MTYVCVVCGAEVDTEGGRVQCTMCGNRILRKKRPPVKKVVKAE